MKFPKDYRSLLRAEFKRRLTRNRKYSLRAFARDLGLSSSRLSEVLSSKQGLSRQRAEGVGSKLGFLGDRLEWFCELVESEDGRSHFSREVANLKRLQLEHRIRQKTVEVPASLRNELQWFDYVIRRLTGVEAFQDDPAWIAKAIGISESEVKRSITRMLKNGMLTRDSKGKLQAPNHYSAHGGSISREGMIRAYEMILSRAIHAVRNLDSNQRNLRYHIFALHEGQYARVLELLQKLDDELDELTYEKSPAHSVYCLAVQFFNIQNPKL